MLFQDPSEPVKFSPQLTSKNRVELRISIGLGVESFRMHVRDMGRISFWWELETCIVAHLNPHLMLFPNPSEPVQFSPQLTSKNRPEVRISIGLGGAFYPYAR